MLKKLYRYEFYSLFRSLLPIYGAALGFALLSRLTYLFDFDNLAFSIISGMVTTVYVFSIIAVAIIGIVVVVVRFYRNLLKEEGYLTFSLPFTPTQHILCKLICGFVVILLDAAVVILSLFLLGVGTDVLPMLWNTFKEMLSSVLEYTGTSQLIVTVIEIALMAICSVIQSILMFYASIAIGQQFKSRVGGAVVAYIALYAAVQTVNSVLLLLVTAVNINRLEMFFENGVQSVQLTLLFPLLESIVLSVVYFCITRHFLTQKLNLE